jgi:hypothetical protein
LVTCTANDKASASFGVTATFQVGTITVNCSVTDKANLSASGSLTITVPTPPGPVVTGLRLRVPGALASAGGPVTYVVTAIVATVKLTGLKPYGEAHRPQAVR